MKINDNAALKTSKEIEIHAPLNVVWAIHVDINSWKKWHPDISEALLKGNGSTFDWKSGGYKLKSTIKKNILASLLTLFLPMVLFGNVFAYEEVKDKEMHEACTLEYMPVCVVDESGKLKTYANQCFAKGKEIIKDSPCGEILVEDNDTEEVEQLDDNSSKKQESKIDVEQKPCTREYIPVCGKISVEEECVTGICIIYKEETFSNKCVAGNAKSEILYQGICGEKKKIASILTLIQRLQKQKDKKQIWKLSKIK